MNNCVHRAAARQNKGDNPHFSLPDGYSMIETTRRGQAGVDHEDQVDIPDGSSVTETTGYGSGWVYFR